MAANYSSVTGGRSAAWADLGSWPNRLLLRQCVVAVGITWAVLFVLIGLKYELQLFADGAMFSYSVAVQDAWAFHWHNISGRVFVYLIAEAPAELYGALTADPKGGIELYGLLFFSTQLLGLAGTWVADRSPGRVFFAYACASTACLCPLVFGFPTEMWVAHALFWPTLAVCHHARATFVRVMLVFVLLLALMLTHGAAVILAGAILLSLWLRGTRDAAYKRAAGAFLLAISIWVVVKLALPPDNYDGPMMHRAALHFFDETIFTRYMVALLVCALTAYAAVFVALLRFNPPKAHIYAAAVIAAALSAYWLWFDGSLHGNDRYPMRTIVFIATAAFGAAAAVHAVAVEGRLNPLWPFLPRLMDGIADDAVARAIVGAFMVVTLVHAVETTRFVRAWVDYKGAVQAVAMGTASDPVLGDARFISSDRIRPDLNRLAWFSTTQFLSVLVAPKFRPARLVVDPMATYFWLSCKTARANEMAERAIPVESRQLVRVHACLHR
jgi:hypothetical protein